MTGTTPAPHRDRTLVALATYDERENLPRLLDAIWKECDVDVLVIDDHSPDGTGDLADARARQDQRLTVVHRPAKAGVASAHLLAFRHALVHGYERVVEMDADFSHPPEDVPRLIAASATSDVVLGSRMTPGARVVGRSWGRQALTRFGCAYARTVLGLRVRDCTGGFRCSTRAALSRLPLDAITSEGYGFQIELNCAWERAGTRIAEIPIVFRDRTEGRSKMSLRIVFEAFAVVPRLRLSGARVANQWRRNSFRMAPRPVRRRDAGR